MACRGHSTVFAPPSHTSSDASDVSDSDTELQLPVVDLTNVSELPFGAMRVSSRNPSAFTAATRRIYSRRERTYNRADPAVVTERLDTVTDAADDGVLACSVEHPARTRALNHLSSAYAITAYSHAALSVTLAAVAVWAIIAFAHALSGDVSRKTRGRAEMLGSAAAECVRNMLRNDCAGHAAIAASTGSSPSYSPALDSLCLEWTLCAGRAAHATIDARSASVWAEALAETIDAFASRISSGMLVLGVCITVLGTFALSLTAFGYLHRRLADSGFGGSHNNSNYADNGMGQRNQNAALNGSGDGWEQVIGGSPNPQTSTPMARRILTRPVNSVDAGTVKRLDYWHRCDGEVFGSGDDSDSNIHTPGKPSRAKVSITRLRSPRALQQS
jgi:hypothetical protein